jgi:hypothetical protein
MVEAIYFSPIPEKPVKLPQCIFPVDKNCVCAKPDRYRSPAPRIKNQAIQVEKSLSFFVPVDYMDVI